MFDDDKCGYQHKLEVHSADQSGLGAFYKLDKETLHLSAKVERHRKNIEKLERKLRKLERKLRKERRRASSVFEALVDAMSRRSDILCRAFSALRERERTATHE